MEFDGIDLLDWLHRYWRQDQPRLKWLCSWRGYVWPPDTTHSRSQKR